MRAVYFMLFIFLATFKLYAQEGIHYYGANGRILSSEKGAIICKKVKKGVGNRYRIVTSSRAGDEWIFRKSEKYIQRKDNTYRVRKYEETLFPRTYTSRIEKIDNDSYIFTDQKLDKVRRSGSASSLIPLHLDGEVTVYYPNGTLKSVSTYRNNELVSNKNWLPDGTEYIHNIFSSTDIPPMYSFGNDAFKNYLIDKMAEAKLPINEIQDELVIGVVVMTTGELAGTIAVKGKVESVNQFFIESIESLPGTWEPARLNGEKVKCFIQIPINFTKNVSLLQNLELTDSGMLFWDK